MSHARKLPRGHVLSALLVCACLAAALVATRARAQQPSNTNSSAQQSAKPRAKRITPLKSADSAQGSRVTITSDGELNDYSAYRSGDRFIVVIPQAQGGGDSGVRGRGFEGAQVSRRGNDLVYTFKLEPGATAKVNQRFNRLDVQFTATKQAASGTNTSPTPSPAATPRTPPEISGVKPAQTPATASPTPARVNTSAATSQTPGVVPSTTLPTNPATTNPNEASPSSSITSAPTVAPSEMPVASPSVAPATPDLVAQAQPTAAAAINVVAPSTGATTSTLGTTIARNWHWIVAALLVVGVGLLLVARFGERRTDAPPPPALEATTAKPALKETTPAKLETSKVATTPEKIAAVTAAATLAETAQPSSFKSKKGKKSKKGRAAARLAAEAESAKLSTTEAGTGSKSLTTPATTESKVTESTAVLTDAALLATPLVVAKGVESQPAETKSIEKRAEAIAPASAADAERVGEEVRKLLAGKTYDEAIVGATDPATREMVASELLAALSSRNSERNAHARTAFLKHNYFEDATRDLQSAEAPAQRASAAHALSLLRERKATAHLVAALEDPSAEVRRASVEALAGLKDPAALGPLEALRWRETSRLVPRSLIQHAIEACTPSSEDDETTLISERTTSDATAQESAVATETTKEVETIAGVEMPVLDSAAEATAESAAVGDEIVSDADEKILDEEQSFAATPLDMAHVAAPPVEEPVVESRATTETVGLPTAEETVEASEPLAATPQFDLSVPGVENAPGAAEMTATAETVYTFDESEAPAWSARSGAGDESSRGTGGLEFESQPAADNFGRTSAPNEAAESHVYVAPEFAVASDTKAADDWLDIDVDEQHLSPGLETAHAEPQPAATQQAITFEPAGGQITPPSSSHVSAESIEHAEPLDLREEVRGDVSPSKSFVTDLGGEGSGLTLAQKGLEISGAAEAEDVSIIPKSIQLRLESDDAAERAASVRALARLNTGEAFHQICAAFDDPAREVRDAAARAVYDISDDRADSFTRALRESPPERRRQVGAALASSGLADEAISQLTGESRERTYDAFSLLFLMAKAGESAPLIRAIETHPETEVRLAVVKLLALSGQQEVLPSFKRLAVRGSLPAEVRSAVMEAIYQISSSGAAAQDPKPSRTA